MVKVSMHQESIATENMYVPKNRSPTYIGQKPKEDKNRQFNNS